MKNKIIYIALLLLYTIGSMAQQESIVTYRIKIDDKNFKVTYKEKKIKGTNDAIINSLIEENKIISFRQSFPNSKNPNLLKLYSLTVNTNDTSYIKKNLLKSKSVKKLEKRKKPKSMYEPSDYMYTLGWLWHLDKIEANKAWDITKGSADVTIAIIDTKFDYEHPDLHNKFILDYDPYSGVQHVQIQSNVSGIDKHGTAVAGTAIGETDGGGQLASVGFNTMFYAYTWNGDDVAKAHHASFVLGVDVISCSFYGPCSFNQDDSEAIHEIINNGTIMVASAGNGLQQCSGGETCPYCSLNDDRIIIVSTTGHNDEHTLFNDDGTETTDSHYPGVDICAPGIDIPVATPSGGTNWPYYGKSGATSIATPIVAGTCALMRSVNKCISPEAVEDVLKSTADPISDEYLYPGLLGAGRLNAYQAVLGAIEEGTNFIANTTLYSTQIKTGLYISASNTIIDDHANITFRAEEYTTLEAGFEVELGGQLIIEKGTYTCN